MDRKTVTFALPTGGLLNESMELLSVAGIDIEPLRDRGRRLVLKGESASFVLCKPWDVPVYVEYGVADFGIVGNDVLWEVKRDVVEIADLGIGKCKMILAIADGRRIDNFWGLKVATKYPNIALDFFSMKEVEVEIIKLSGSIELAPVVGLADAIVDITATGRTLRENGLVVLEEIASISGRLVVNRLRYKMFHRELSSVIGVIERVVNNAQTKG